MQWSFSWPWFFGGIVVAIVGVLILKYYRQIADNMASGVSSYEKVKLVGILVSVSGLILMANLHSLVIFLIARIFMPGN